MMGVNYLTLLLVNMVAGHALLAYYVYSMLRGYEQKHLLAGFAAAGLVAFVGGLYIIFTWPLSGSYNIAFGETSIFFGMFFLGSAFALAKDLPLTGIAFYGIFAGLAAITIGLQIYTLGMTKQPLVSGIGFVLSGLGGVLLFPTLVYRNRNLQLLLIGILILAALIWAFTGYLAYPSHLVSYAKYGT